MKNYRLYLLCGLMVFLAGACKKDDDGGIDPNNIPFEDLSKEEQFDKITAYMQNFVGKEYRLLTRIVFDENGDHVVTETPDDCQQQIIIRMPEQFDFNHRISQIAPEGQVCGISTSTQADIRESSFTNYKWSLQTYKVIINDDDQGNIVFNGIIKVQPQVEGTDISEYLEIIEPFQEDWNAAQNNPGTIEARKYRDYHFVRVH